ncbi:MAG: uracil-DNA glycosylase [Roseovarius sp.]|nr:uracil-DNA glycosylase [Roseovarius sp.]
MESGLDFHAALAALDWQIDLGATEAIGDTPVNRYEQAAAPAAPRPATPGPATSPAPQQETDPVAVARDAANAARDLDNLQAALSGFELCELKRGARNTVFADGHPAARLMIIGEAPGRDEDMQGKPFVGRAGRLLDRMLAAIGHDRTAQDAEKAVYISNILPWRPPSNRDPNPQEIAMMVPFMQRHVALADPDIVVLMGNISCQAGLGQRGITRLRGQWAEAYGKPALPMFHPAFLLRKPHAKRDAWADLLELQARLRTGS